MSPIRLFTDLDGRIGLRSFWLGTATVALALLTIQRVAPQLTAPATAAMVIAFAKAFALFPWCALAAKRARDRGGSAVFGILLICTIVLPEQMLAHVPFAWRPSLEAIGTIAWVIAFIDLGLMPSAHRDEDELATVTTRAKASD
jgi:uncharacterized membrane protein YhaH (DUF805 family)